MLDDGLSVQQFAVIRALSSGATTIQAAQEAGVHRNTIRNWRRNVPAFQRALTDAKNEVARQFRGPVKDPLDLAITAIRDLLCDPATPVSVRLKAALAVIRVAPKIRATSHPLTDHSSLNRSIS